MSHSKEILFCTVQVFVSNLSLLTSIATSADNTTATRFLRHHTYEVLSMDQIGTVVQVGVHASSVRMNFPTQMELKSGMYVVVVYDNKWYDGCIAD